MIRYLFLCLSLLFITSCANLPSNKKAQRNVASNSLVDKTKYFFEALDSCLAPSASIKDRVENYVYLNNHADGYFVNTCEDKIVDVILPSKYEQEIYIDNISQVNSLTGIYPNIVCNLSLSVRKEWENRYLNLLTSEYFNEYKPSGAGFNMALSTMAFLTFRVKIPNRKALSLISSIALIIGIEQYTNPSESMEKMRKAVLMERQKNVFSNVGIPIDPTFLLTCPGISSISTRNLHELGERLDEEVAAQSLALAGLTASSLGIWSAKKIFKKAKLVKKISNAKKIFKTARTGGAILASAGPQATLFAGGILVYEGAEQAINSYIKNKKKRGLEQNLSDAINSLENSINRIEKNLLKLPDKFYNLNAVELEPFDEEISSLNFNLNSGYIRSRDVLEKVYNLSSFYNFPIMERTLEFQSELLDIQSIKTDTGRVVNRDLSWIENAYLKIKKDEQSNNNLEFSKFQAQTASSDISSNKVVSAYEKYQEALEKFDSDIVTKQIEDNFLCGLDLGSQETYKHDLERTSMIQLLNSKDYDAYENYFKTQNRNDQKNLGAYERMILQNLNTSEKIRNSIHDSTERYVNNSAKGGAFSNRYLNSLRLNYLDRANKRSRKKWHDTFKKGQFCTNQNALLHQAAQYFSYKDFRFDSLYKNKFNLKFFESIKKSILSDLNRDDYAESDNLNFIIEKVRDAQKKLDRRGATHGGAL